MLRRVSRSALREQRHLRVVSDDAPAVPTRALSDDELIDAFERGDLRTAELLYDRLERVVNATLVKVLGERGQDHEDLVQSAFEQILVTLARRQFARACSLSSWAVSVTTHLALSAIRKRRAERRQVEPDSELPDVSRPSDPGPDGRAMVAALRDELGKLSLVTAGVVVMHEVLGHDLAEISVLTGLSVAAAQSRLVRGRAELKRRLEARFPQEGT